MLRCNGVNKTPFFNSLTQREAQRSPDLTAHSHNTELKSPVTSQALNTHTNTLTHTPQIPGVSQLVVAVNKLDTTEWSEERMKEVRHSLRQFLKGVGYKDADVTYVPCSGLTGENLVKRTPGGALDAWYSGPTLLEAIGERGGAGQG